MNKKIRATKFFVYIIALVFVVLFSVGYSALSSTLSISGTARYNVRKTIRVINNVLQGTTNSGVEQFSPNYTWNTTTTGVNLTKVNSTVTYAVTIKNSGSSPKAIVMNITSNSNSNVTYTASNMPTNNIIAANTTVTINVTVKYNTSTLPATTTDTMTITYLFLEPGAMFDKGQVVNAKMKQFVDSSATYETQDTSILKIQRYTSTPSSTYLTDTYKVSDSTYAIPIYMWYNSSSKTIYWYTTASDVYYNTNSSYFYSNLRALNSISNLSDISSEFTTNMSYMFYATGYSSTSFTLNVGTKFNTVNVTNMSNMFAYTGHDSTAYTLTLGSNFDTTNVTNMNNLFRTNGYSNTSFTFSLGSKFNTSNVTTMNSMFYGIGYGSTSFTLSLGSYFDTAKVTNMTSMFREAGYSSTSFTLSLGSKFDTSKVTTMYQMFYQCGYTNTGFSLTLGSKFYTSNVTNMSYMFYQTGYSSTSFTLSLGSNFDTAKVTNMAHMFNATGRSSTSFTLSLGSKFDTSQVTDMTGMFRYLGYSNTSFKKLDLGSKFNTSKVTTMNNMFNSCRYLTTIYAPTTFVTTAVTSSSAMFTSSTNLVGGAGTVYDSSHIDAAYAHIDSTSNPGYFTGIGAKIATFYYNSNTTSGSLTVSKAITSCVPASGSTSCTVTVPSVVSSSVGKYNSTYKGVSTSLSSMASSSLSISSDTTYYANYSKSVTNYYYGSSYTSRTLKRNEYFTSTTAMAARLATSNTSTTNYSTAVGPGSSVWTGLSTAKDTTAEYTSVQAAADSNSATLYTVYTLNITYAKGSNVSSIGATSGSCKITTSSTSCNVSLPTITASSGYSSVGWNTSTGAITGYSPGTNYSLSTNGTKLYANAVSGGVTLTFNANGGSVNPSSKTVVPGNTYTDLPTPTKSGNDFAGWYANFTGSNYINYGRSYMWTDKISVHFRAYRDDWSGNYAIISSAEDGGWEIYVTAGKPEGWMYDSGTGYKTIKSSTALTAGWHTFDLIFDGSKEYLWVDGTNVATSAAFSSGKIGYNSGNSLILGAEAGSGSTPSGEYFVGKIADLMINHNSTRITGNHYNSYAAPAAAATLYADWLPPIYHITLNKSGGSGGTTDLYYRYNYHNGNCYYYTDSSCTTCLTNSTITVPTKSGKVLDGFYTASGGSGTQYVNGYTPTGANSVDQGGLFINNLYTKKPSDINSSYTDTITLYAAWGTETRNDTADPYNGKKITSQGDANYTYNGTTYHFNIYLYVWVVKGENNKVRGYAKFRTVPQTSGASAACIYGGPMYVSNKSKTFRGADYCSSYYSGDPYILIPSNFLSFTGTESSPFSTNGTITYGYTKTGGSALGSISGSITLN